MTASHTLIRPRQDPSLPTRVAIMRPQLERMAADVLCLQEVHSQDGPQGRTPAALDTLLAATKYENYQRLTTTTTDGKTVGHPRSVICESSGPARPTGSPPPTHPTRPPTRCSGNDRSCTRRSTSAAGGCYM